MHVITVYRPAAFRDVTFTRLGEVNRGFSSTSAVALSLVCCVNISRAHTRVPTTRGDGTSRALRVARPHTGSASVVGGSCSDRGSCGCQNGRVRFAFNTPVVSLTTVLLIGQKRTQARGRDRGSPEAAVPVVRSGWLGSAAAPTGESVLRLLPRLFRSLSCC